MKTFFADGKGQGHFEVLPTPPLRENEVLVKVCYCGVCGTDQDLFSGDCSFAENGQVSYPVRLGHEWSGVVESVGSGVTTLAAGDKVVGDNTVTCGECEHCQKGDYANCRNTRNVGTIDPVYNGAFSEYYVAPAHHLYKIPKGISLKEAALCEPFSVAYGAIKEMDITADSVVVVVGTGCIGLAAVVLAKCAGAKRTILIGRNPDKLRVAEELGAVTVNLREQERFAEVARLTNGNGADFVIECSGAADTFSDSLKYARNEAKVALIGFYEKSEKDVNVDILVSKALRVFGVMGKYGNMRGVLEMLGKHKPNLLPMITGELPFDDCMRGFVRKNYPNAIKTMVTICEE